MKKLNIKLDNFSEDEIKKASAVLTTADIRFWKNRNSLFYKDENKDFVNIKNEFYGMKISLITQFVFNIAYLNAGKNNNAFSIKYSTINEHLGKYQASINYISEVINQFVGWKIITRYRTGRYSWNMKLTDEGYQMLFGAPIGSNAYLLQQTKNSHLIYEFIKSKIRAFRAFCGSLKKKTKLEFIKKVMLGMRFYYDDTKLVINNNSAPPPTKTFNENDFIVSTNRGELSINEIFSDEDMKEMFE